MAVELETLYENMKMEYEVTLQTESCFGKRIGWFHMVESVDFAELLHGDELVFNSGLNYTSEEWLLGLIDALDRAHAGGLIVALRDGHVFPKETVRHCNDIRFPLFSANWSTPYIDVMRKFSEILLKNEQNETNLVAALKDAIYYPENEEMYLNHFEINGYFRDMTYTVTVLSCFAYDTRNGNETLKRLQKALRDAFRRCVIYEEKGRLILLAAGYAPARLKEELQRICGNDPNIYAGIGTAESQIRDVHRSYQNAYTAYELTKTTIPKNLLCYGELGIYKVLADVKEPGIYPEFVEEVLGPLIRHDQTHGTRYLYLLNIFFDNDCSILNTARALYCHKNTIQYKINAIRDILGYDIMSNENRVRIAISYYILRLGENYYYQEKEKLRALLGDVQVF